MENIVKEYLDQGLVHYKNKDFDSAISCYTEALKIDPDNVAAHNSRASLYTKKREFDLAIEDYTSVIRINPKNANSFYGRGIAYKNLKFYEQAVSDLETALGIDPDNVNAAYAKKCLEESRLAISQENEKQNGANEFMNTEEEQTMKSFGNAGMEKFGESVKNQIGSDSKAANTLRSMKNRMGIGTPERNETDAYERGMKIVPECISANENEIPVRQYNIAVLRNLLKFDRAEGRMQVTNKRIIFRAAGRSIGGRTTLQHEYAINEIAGIEAGSNYRFSFLYLIFAFLIIAAAGLIIYGSAAPGMMSGSILGAPSLKNLQNSRISGIMYPKHLQKAYANRGTAAAKLKEAEEKLAEAEEISKDYQQGVERYTTARDEDSKSSRRITYSFRNQRMTAQEILDLIIPEKDAADTEYQESIVQLEDAKKNEAEMSKKFADSVKTWKVLMTLLGLILGAGGLIPFFMVYKKFSLKLFILNFSIFGFALSFGASGMGVFNLLMGLSSIVTVVCIFIFCFRPNLVISIKNKMGTGEGPVDIRSRGKALSFFGFEEVIPTEETESAIREIGAMIGDIQKLGDLGLERWIKK